jgi:hypothetical protein
MLDRFEQFASSPISIQFAQGGLWESAWSSPIDRLPSHLELVSYLALSKEVAFEAFLADSFFGARMTGSPQEVETFSAKCVQAARTQESFFPVFQREIGCPVRGQQPAFAEIGCINAWRSVGAFRIRNLQSASTDFDQLWRSLQDSSVGQDTRHTKAIEFAFESPMPHWFGVPVSALDGLNGVSESLFRQALRLNSLLGSAVLPPHRTIANVS